MKLVILFAPSALLALDPAAEEIMAKVGENQDRAEVLRSRYVYRQKLRARLVRTNGKLAREEFRTYDVFPGAKESEKKLVEFKGGYESKGKWHEYSEPGFEYKDVDLDGDLIDDLSNDLVNDAHSRDGFDTDLFPLTSAKQEKYTYQLLGTSQVDGRTAWRIKYAPRKKWEGWFGGEALIDTEDHEPISVYSKQAFKIPWGVRVFLGTNLEQVGFTLNYKRIAPGVWFPVSYGTEFRFGLLWRYKRVVTMSLSSSHFREAGADSTVTFADVK